MDHEGSKYRLLESLLTRRRVVRGMARSALALPMLSSLSALGLPDLARAEDVEVLDVTPELVAAAKNEGTLLLRHASPTVVYDAIGKAFDDEFGIKLMTDRKVGPVGQQVFAQEEHAGKHVMDVVESGDPEGLKALDKEGLYLHFTLKDLDQKLRDRFYIPDLAYCAWPESLEIVYNPSLLPHDEAKRLFKTWGGILDPSLKGAIGITDPTKVAICFALCLMWYRHPKYGMEFIKELGRQQPRVYAGSPLGREDLYAGAIKVFLPGVEGQEMQNFEQGAQAAWTTAEIEPSYPNLYVAISEGAPHPNAARLFVAWLFTPDGAKAVAQTQARSSLVGLPDMRSAPTRLKATDWWEPYPDDIGWIPDLDDWIESFPTLAPQFSDALNGR